MNTFVVLAVLVGLASAQYTQYLFNPTQVAQYGSRCLDGSPSGFYYRNASTSESQNKFQIYMDGGGFCVPNATANSGCDDCYARAKTKLGSSNYWTTPAYTPPDFSSTWNTIVIPYCGGDIHTGTKMTEYGGLYYAGHNTSQFDSSVNIKALSDAGWLMEYPQYSSNDHRNRSASAYLLYSIADCYLNQACIKANPSAPCL